MLQEADDRRPQWIIGCDEVGRGCLAGPVMVGACLFRAEDIPLLPIPAGLKDSKLLTPKKRESLLDPLRAWAAGTAVGSCDNRGIDSYGIMEALGAAAIQAIDQAVFGLIGAGDRVAVILDGPYDYISPAFRSLLAPQARIDPDDMTVTTVVKGDRRCACVAGASVIAKVIRDRYMVDLADRHGRLTLGGRTRATVPPSIERRSKSKGPVLIIVFPGIWFKAGFRKRPRWYRWEGGLRYA